MTTQSAAPPGPESGTLFGRYQLLRRLAVGGMAEVFVARSASLGGVNRTCVIKRILPEYSQNRTFVSMFIDEARILIGLNHVNVVRLYDFGQVDGSYFMALEYVSGCNLVAILQQIFSAQASMDPMAAAFVGREVGRGLHHAHVQQDAQGNALGIVHRDVSPHNVLVSLEGHIKVADFGIAQARNKMTLTTPGTVMGKFAYMAPEQATGARVDARADVFSLGVLLHEALAGARLFSAPTPAETLVKLVNWEPPPPSRTRPQVPADLDAVVMRALQKQPVKRFQTADELAVALDGLLQAAGYDDDSFRRFLRDQDAARLAGPEAVPQAPAKGARGNTQKMFLIGGGARRTTEPSVPQRPQPPPQVTPVLEADRVALQLSDAFKREPNLWTLCALGARHKEQARASLAASAFRSAAGAFAWRHLLIQALVAHDRAGPLISETAWESDIQELSRLSLADHAGLARYMHQVDQGGFFRMLMEADPGTFGADQEKTSHHRVIPMYGSVSPENLVHLMRCTRVRHYAPGTAIVREGDVGDTLYALGEGRVVVWCKPPEGTQVEGGRVYLSSLAEGDFFGEFGFLAGEPRSASVEAVLDTWVLEVDRKDVRHLINQHPEMSGPLMDFYKARVVELLMAKNAVFARLPPAERRLLLSRAELQAFADNELIIKEGDDGDAFFFIKQGEVEVFTERDGIPIFINKLREGEFFGEIAVIWGSKRTASVRAMSDVEVLRIGREALEEVLRMRPDLRHALERAMDARVVEAQEQVRSAQELLGLL
ncbi:MAG: cyclic nucleotide-binding domain-containing protein [Deltaproteobacteria bacterium]|nr:cyclic nucleotide-binding domain-containing protein [Deltaproteobacteria bacterium]